MATLDVLKQALEHEVKQYRNRDFATSLMADISISADKTSPLVHFGHSRRIGYIKYNVKAWAGPSLGLEVQSSDRRKAVISAATRKHLHDFLDGIARFENPLDDVEAPRWDRQGRAWTAQEQWWSSNSLSFRLLHLPLELRNAIYAASLPTEISSYPRAGRPSVTAGFRDLSLIFLSRQVYSEVCSQLFTCTTFTMRATYVLERWLRNKHFLENVRRIRICGMCLCDLPDGTRLAFRRLAVTRLIVHLQTGSHTEPCIATLRQLVQGHSGVVLVGSAESQRLVAFRKACNEALKSYRVWQANASVLMVRKVTLADYDAWKQYFEDDEDGGVQIEDVPDVSKASLDIGQSDNP